MAENFKQKCKKTHAQAHIILTRQGIWDKIEESLNAVGLGGASYCPLKCVKQLPAIHRWCHCRVRHNPYKHLGVLSCLSFFGSATDSGELCMVAYHGILLFARDVLLLNVYMVLPTLPYLSSTLPHLSSRSSPCNSQLVLGGKTWFTGTSQHHLE